MMRLERGDTSEVPRQQPATTHRRVVDGQLPIVVDAGHPGVAEEHLRQPARREEVVGTQRSSDEHVVVEVHEVLAEAVDAVQRRLDGVRVERRQATLREDVAMRHQLDSLVVEVEPRAAPGRR